MSKIVSPKLFRLKTTERYLSNWYTKSKVDFATNLHQDIEIRNIVKNLISNAGIDRVVISRTSGSTAVDIYCARPGAAIGQKGATISLMEEKIYKTTGLKVSLMVHEVKQAYLSANIVANLVAESLARKVPPKMAMRQQLDRIEAAGALGARIYVAGIGPVKQARVEKLNIRGGKIPLTMLRAKIDYGFATVKTDKMLGIKVWIYKGEI